MHNHGAKNEEIVKREQCNNLIRLGEIFMSICDENAKSQQWQWEKVNSQILKEWREGKRKHGL